MLILVVGAVNKLLFSIFLPQNYEFRVAAFSPTLDSDVEHVHVISDVRSR